LLDLAFPVPRADIERQRLLQSGQRSRIVPPVKLVGAPVV
jgi:hypothetical protein